jgi:hypothetical protein
MKYSVIKVVNGNFSVVSEHGDKQSALVKFHDICKTHWNAEDVKTAMVAILDENLNVVEGHREFIYHTDEPEDTTVEAAADET